MDTIYSVAAVTNPTREGALARVHPLAQTGELFASAPARKGGYFQLAACREKILKEGRFRQLSNAAELEALIDQTLAAHPADVQDFRFVTAMPKCWVS